MKVPISQTVVLKAQVVDSGGLTAEALVRVNVILGPTCDGALCPDPGGGGGCGCRAAPPAGVDALVPLLLCLGLLLYRRRRRRRHR